MNKYRRKDQITNEEMQSFREIEMNKILQKTILSVKEKPSRRMKLIPSIMVSLLLIIAVIVTFNLSNPENPIIEPSSLFTITEVSANSFVVKDIKEKSSFNFYYNSHIVFRNDKISYNELFNYNFEYQYVPEEFVTNVDVDIDAFPIGSYRYFISITVNGETRYNEIDVFNDHSRDIGIFGLEIINYEDDINELFSLLDKFPPLLDEVTSWGAPKYLPNENVDLIDDDRMKSNYLTYVEHFYISDTFYEGEPEGTETVVKDAIIIVDNDGNYITQTTYTSLYDSEIVTPDGSLKTIEQGFNFYNADGSSILAYMMDQFSYQTDDIIGRVTNFQSKGYRYFYTYVDISDSTVDLSNVAYVKYTYKLGSKFVDPYIEKEVIVNAFYHQGDLIIPPVNASIDENDIMYGLFSKLALTFYDEDDEIIYDIDLIGTR